MRPAAVKKVLSVLLLLVAVAALGTAAKADDGCVQGCADRWVADKQACLDSLNARLADLDAQAAACYENNTDPLSIAICVRNVNIARYAANNDYKKCVNMANTVAWNCYRACAPSQAKP